MRARSAQDRGTVIVDLRQRLAGKRAVVTAAGQGIGRAVAERLAAEGAEVFASDLDAGLLEGFEGETLALDATDGAAVEAYFGGFEAVDILVHAVGFVHQGTLEECSPEDWRHSCTVTLDSVYNVYRAALPKMKVKGGSMIAIASVASSIKGLPKRAAYGATKAAVIGLSKSVAADYIDHGIRCNAVCPGTVESPSLRQRIDALAESMGSAEQAYRFFIDRQPSGRFGTPEEVAALCAVLASEDGAFITGQAISVDGGITI